MKSRSPKKPKLKPGRPKGKIKGDAFAKKRDVEVDIFAKRERPKLRADVNEYAPARGVIPLLKHTEAPKTEWCEALLQSVSKGMGIETASAYAELPSQLVRNWLARGREEEAHPFDESKYGDEDARAEKVRYFESVTKPCYALWMLWKKTRAEFLMNCVQMVASSTDWRAQAWLLERLEPGSFQAPKAPPPVKRILEYHEQEVREAVGEAQTDDKVVLYVPDNGRIQR